MAPDAVCKLKALLGIPLHAVLLALQGFIHLLLLSLELLQALQKFCQLSILDDQMRRGKTDMQFLEAIRKRFDGKNQAIVPGSLTVVQPGSNFPTPNTSPTFTIRHFTGDVDYSVEGLLEENAELISGDMMHLLNSTKNDFVRKLFGQSALKTVMHPAEKTAVMQAQVISKPLRMPSVARRGTNRPRRVGPREPTIEDGVETGNATSPALDRAADAGLSYSGHGVSGQFLTSLNIIKKSILNPNTNSYFIFCIKPNDRRIANQFDSKCVRGQIQTFGIHEISQRLKQADFSIFLPFAEFLGLADSGNLIVGSEREKAEWIINDKRWLENEARAGNTGVFLSERCWASISDVSEDALKRTRYSKANLFDDENASPSGRDINPFSDSKVDLMGHSSYDRYYDGKDLDSFSDAGASAYHGDMFRNHETRDEMAARGNRKDLTEVEEVLTSGSRKRWLALVWLFTFWMPDFLISGIGRIKRPDMRMAWREKLAINIMIWLSCGFVVFFLLGFPNLICPKQNVFSGEELSSHNGKDNNGAYVSLHGVVFDLGAFMPNHYPSIVPQSALQKYAGLDVTALFPVQVSTLCRQVGNVAIDESVTIQPNPVNITGNAVQISGNDPNANYHDFRAFTNDSRPYWFIEQMGMLNKDYLVGYVGYSADYVGTMASKPATSNVRIINGRIYDLTNYINGAARVVPIPGRDTPSNVNTNFMDQNVILEGEVGKLIALQILHTKLSKRIYGIHRNFLIMMAPSGYEVIGQNMPYPSPDLKDIAMTIINFARSSTSACSQKHQKALLLHGSMQ